jgi:hypothetical protein
MQVVDANGNVFGAGLEVTGSDGKPKVPVINTNITIGTTAIVGGVVNRILFQGIGNVVQESSSFTYDDTLKKFTLTGPIGSVIQHTALTNYNGLSGFQLNVADGTERAFFKLNPSTGEIRIGGTGSGYFPTFYAQGVEAMRIFASTRNVGINTTTDAGYKADINGTLRVQSSLVIANPAFTLGASITHSANATLSIVGGPASESIVIGPSNRIFINAGQVRFPNGSVQIAGTLSVGAANTTAATMLWVTGGITASSAIARGISLETTLVAAANNDVLVGLDVKPTYTNGAFTGVTNVDLRTKNAGVVIGANYGYGALYGYGNDGIVQVRDAGTGILGSTYSTQLIFRPAGNSAGLNSNYWAYLEQSATAFLLTSGRYQPLYLRAGTGGSTNDMFFQSSTSTVMMIKGTTSNVLIGTTTDSGFKFDVNGTARATGVITGNQFNASNNGGSYSAIGVVLLDYGDGLRIGYSSSVQKITLFTAAGTPRFQVVNSGSILIGTTTEIASSLLTLNSSTRGFLPPRMTNAEMLAIATPATSLMVYDTTNNKLCCYDGTTWQNLF